MWVPPVIIHFIFGFSLINHPANGVPHLWKPPYVHDLYWLVVSNILYFHICSMIYGTILSIDFHIFQDGYCMLLHHQPV